MMMGHMEMKRMKTNVGTTPASFIRGEFVDIKDWMLRDVEYVRIWIRTRWVHASWSRGPVGGNVSHNHCVCMCVILRLSVPKKERAKEEWI